MTPLLQKAYAEAALLPEADQDTIAALMLEEIASERRWQESFAKSQDWLAQMAREAIEEDNAGKTMLINREICGFAKI